jgi:hypothetical protein
VLWQLRSDAALAALAQAALAVDRQAPQVLGGGGPVCLPHACMRAAGDIMCANDGAPVLPLHAKSRQEVLGARAFGASLLCLVVSWATIISASTSGAGGRQQVYSPVTNQRPQSGVHFFPSPQPFINTVVRAGQHLQ